jgi:hypothetical protein
MARNGDEKTTDESSLTDTELKELNEAFKALGVKPKTKSSAEFRQWMLGCSKWTTTEHRLSESSVSEPQGATNSHHVTKHNTQLHAPK